MEPTPQALRLWPAVRDALRQLQQSLAPESFDPHQASNTFVLAMADATAAELVPRLVDTLETDAPGISLRIIPLATRDPRKLLDEETIDLAVGYFPSVLADLTSRAQVGKAVAFRHQRLYDGEYVCVMRHGHPLASGPVHPEPLLRGAPPAGEFWRATVRLHRRGTRQRSAASGASCSR